MKANKSLSFAFFAKLNHQKARVYEIRIGDPNSLVHYRENKLAPLAGERCRDSRIDEYKGRASLDYRIQVPPIRDRLSVTHTPWGNGFIVGQDASLYSEIIKRGGNR